jgi:hypothetical protein
MLRTLLLLEAEELLSAPNDRKVDCEAAEADTTLFPLDIMER